MGRPRVQRSLRWQGAAESNRIPRALETLARPSRAPYGAFGRTRTCNPSVRSRVLDPSSCEGNRIACGNRTRASGLRGRFPSRLEERDMDAGRRRPTFAPAILGHAVRTEGIEPTASGLSCRRSTIELRARIAYLAGIEPASDGLTGRRITRSLGVQKLLVGVAPPLRITSAGPSLEDHKQRRAVVGNRTRACCLRDSGTSNVQRQSAGDENRTRLGGLEARVLTLNNTRKRCHLVLGHTSRNRNDEVAILLECGRRESNPPDRRWQRKLAPCGAREKLSSRLSAMRGWCASSFAALSSPPAARGGALSVHPEGIEPSPSG